MARFRGGCGSRGRLIVRNLAIVGIIAVCAAASFATVRKIREVNNFMDSSCKLHSISGAILNTADANGRFPAAAICDKNGKPLLSWRVAILPYLEGDDLYHQFHLDEPWDSPHNIQLLPKMPKTYKLPGDTKTPPDHTHFLVFVGNGAAFEETRGLHWEDFTDGTSTTILVVEAAKAVPWTKPEDLPYDPTKPIAPLLSTHLRGGFDVVHADMSAHFVPSNTPERLLHARVTRNGHEPENPLAGFYGEGH